MFLQIHISSLGSFIGSVITLVFVIYGVLYSAFIRKNPTLLIFSFFTATMFVYLFGYSMYSSSVEIGPVLFWTRICFAGGASIIYSAYRLNAVITGQHSRTAEVFYAGFATILVIAMFVPGTFLFEPVLNAAKSHSSVVKGPLFPVVLLTILAGTGSILVIFIKSVAADTRLRKASAPIIVGLVLWFVEASFDSIFAAILSRVDFKLTLGPAIMTLCLAVYTGKIVEEQNVELDRIRDENEKIYRNLIFDGVSGVYTRDYFKENLAQRIAANKRTGRQDALAFVDIDNFKTVNDELGHKTGDEILALCGSIIHDKSRKSDVAARFGGDEFLLLLAQCPEEDAKVVMGKILSGFRNVLLKSLASWERRDEITLSIGLIMQKHWNDNPEDIIHRADLAMYAAKNKGKNQICIYDPTRHGEDLMPRTESEFGNGTS